jgi:NAD(P)-dependent dehydrogenase (short-subunit alcohol dehydrogenase family)
MDTLKVTGSDLTGRHAIVTGGARGIGRAIAAAIAKAGASVTILGRNPETLALAAAEIGCRYEVADSTETDRFVEVLAKIGPTDILVNNAGSAIAAPFAKQSLADLDRMMAINLRPVFAAVSCVLPGMLSRNWGRIINIASTAGLKGYGYSASYCASKHGLVGLTRALAAEYAKFNLTVNAVCPGFTDTEMFSQTSSLLANRSSRSAEQATALLLSVNPQARLIDPNEVAAAAVYLCQEGSRSITGQSLVIAGGELM